MNSTAELIAAIRQGECVILLDDANRENEGDFVMAAEAVTPEHINFMITHGRGLVCMPMCVAQAQRLQLSLQHRHQTNVFGTKFLTSIEAAQGITTGTSTFDRARTIVTAGRADVDPMDIATPGHVFPILAEEDGVLARRGHTEAACDLARLAGYNPCGVVCEILNEDGTMARLPELMLVAKKHGLKIGCIEDLVHYRLSEASEQSVLVEKETSMEVA
ncbi:MAG: 3,4-dihydroxy-2-butanone-4-phosphate synthase [Pseudomonadota bacterium]